MNEYERLRRQAIVLRDMYPPGTRVECLDMAQIHVNWDNGSSLALNRDEDSFRKLSVKEVEAENRAVENQDEAPEESSGMKMKM